MERLVCVLALAISLVAAGSPTLPTWGPEVSLNVSLGGSLQYSYNRQEIYLFTEVPQLFGLDDDFFDYHEVIWEAPYFGIHLNCQDLSLSFYIPDVILGDLVCYTLPSRISMDLVNHACPLTNEAFSYFTQYKLSNVTYLGTLKYGVDDISAVYMWGIAKQNTFNWCCDISYGVTYRNWCCPIYYEGTASRQPVAFKGHWSNPRSLYASGWDTPAPWVPPVSLTCRRINPDIMYSATNPTKGASPHLASPNHIPPKPNVVAQEKDSELEMEDAGHPLISLLWRRMKKSGSVFSVFGFMDMSEPEVVPPQPGFDAPHSGVAHEGKPIHVIKPGHVSTPDQAIKPLNGHAVGDNDHVTVGHSAEHEKMDHGMGHKAVHEMGHVNGKEMKEKKMRN